MTQPPETTMTVIGPRPGKPDVELVVGFLLLAGVLTSVALLLSGLIWQRAITGSYHLEYELKGINLGRFLWETLRRTLQRGREPRDLVNLGIITLMLTPFSRVAVSWFYFLFVERNWKYSVITGVVLAALTYSLFIR